uniref:Phospholipid scramblase n=1 Tax=Xenopus tropicalis TaxID=8364 RepID=A0A803JIB8_XENTR
MGVSLARALLCLLIGCLVPQGLIFYPIAGHSTFQNHCTYDLLTPSGALLYRAEETRECCGPRFDVSVQNLHGQQVLSLLLPSSYCTWETQLQVFSGTGTLLGYINKTWASMNFTILTPTREKSLEVQGPGWGGGFMSDVNFQVTMYGSHAAFGLITRVWRGVKKEFFSPNDYYAIKFPRDLDVNVKALLVACTIYIDFTYYEARNRRS